MSTQDVMREIAAMKERIRQLEMALIKKDKEIAEIKGQREEGFSEEGLGNWSDKVTLYGTVELDYSYANDSDISDNTVNDSTSDLDIGTVELGAEIGFHEYVTGNVLLKGENLDGDCSVFWDEAFIVAQKEGFPLYFVGGKGSLPFGAFESHFINDPLTQDLYEISDTGATVGYIPGLLDMDLSFTVYRGEVLMSHLLEGAYGLDRTYLDTAATLPAWRTGGMSGSYSETDNVSSYIGNFTLEPMEDMCLAIYYDSEPGDGQRNNTLGGMFHFRVSKLTLDLEYIAALKRERDSVDHGEYKESAMSAAVAYQVTAPFEIAFRYEGFDDDIPGKQDGVLENRYGLGLNYTLCENHRFITRLMFEGRKSRFEKAGGSAVDDDLMELFGRVALEF